MLIFPVDVFPPGLVPVVEGGVLRQRFSGRFIPAYEDAAGAQWNGEWDFWVDVVGRFVSSFAGAGFHAPVFECGDVSVETTTVPPAKKGGEPRSGSVLTFRSSRGSDAVRRCLMELARVGLVVPDASGSVGEVFETVSEIDRPRRFWRGNKSSSVWCVRFVVPWRVEVLPRGEGGRGVLLVEGRLAWDAAVFLGDELAEAGLVKARRDVFDGRSEAFYVEW